MIWTGVDSLASSSLAASNCLTSSSWSIVVPVRQWPMMKMGGSVISVRAIRRPHTNAHDPGTRRIITPADLQHFHTGADTAATFYREFR